jgi:hypothetical protein
MREEISTYILEINEPDSEFCHSRFSRKIPFPRISKGDYLRFDDTGEKVKVREVEHAVWETENDEKKIFTFQTLVWTTKILET